MLLPSVASLADLDINLGGYSVVYAAKKELRAPKINPVSPNSTEITGSGAGQLVIDGNRVYATVHVILKDKDGGVKAEASFTRTKSSTNWSVTLSKATAAGDKVVAYNQIGEEKSPETTVEVKELLADQYKDKLKMPTLEVWSEDLNVLEADAVDDIVNAFKEANKDAEINGQKTFGKDVTSIDVTGKGDKITVTFSDKSKLELSISDKVTVKQITEVSNAPIIDDLKIVDGKLTGKVDITKVSVPARTRVKLVKFGQNGPGNGFCNEKGCTFDKNSGELAEVKINIETGEFSFDLADDTLELGKDIGVIVKEYQKKNNCSTTKPTLAIPNVGVRDPKKLTEAEKDKIREEIRKANTTASGKSKLPDWTANNIPAYIEFDKDGNVKIINPAEVEGDWIDYTKFVPKRNPDGSIQMKTDFQDSGISVEKKELVTNLPPKQPEVKLNDDKTKIIVTPDAADTDAKEVSVTYTGKDGKSKTLTATKGDNGEWTVPDGADGSVDKTTGVITLPTDKVKGETKVNATVTDDGFQANQQDPASSSKGELEVPKVKTKAEQVTDLGGLDPVVMKKWVGDDLNWKDGVKAKDSATAENKTKIDALLAEAKTKFTDETDPGRNTDKQGDYPGKIKVTFDDGSSIEVENQKLYVKNHVLPSTEENVPEGAIDVEVKLGEGVKVDDIDPNSGEVTNTHNGSKETPLVYKTYKVKPGTDLSKYKYPTLDKTIFELIDEKAQDGYADPEWKGQDTTNSKNFVVTDSNKVFTATATKTFKVTVKSNGGTGEEKVETIKKDETYTLPAANTFTPPNEDQEFSGWKVGDDTNLKNPGENITITKDIEVKAIWKPVEYKVSFKSEGGATGSMTDETVTKGSEYVLPTPTFTPQENHEFVGWRVGNDTGLKKVGEKIKISGSVELTAVYSPLAKIEAPVVSVDTNTGNLIITPPTPPEGQEIKSVTVNYQDSMGAGKTLVAEKSADGWRLVPGATNGERADASSGVITIPRGNYKLDRAVKAFANNQVNQRSEEAEATPVEVSFEMMNGGKKGVDSLIKIKDQFYVLPAIHELPEYQLIIPDGKEFDGWEIDGVRKAVGESVKIDKNTVVKALWRDKGTNPSQPEAPSPEEYEIPGIKIRDHYTPTFPVYVTVPKTEKVEKAEEVPVSLETHKAYIAGYEDDTLRAEGNLTRAEAAAMVTRLAGLDLSDTSMPDFKDMQKNAWYFRYINAAVKAKMLDADNGMMRPNDKITRAEFAKMLAAIDKENSSVSKFDDIKGHRYEKEINKIYGNNRIEGYEDGSFRPDAYLTRAESAAFLNRMFNRIADKEAYAGLEDKLAKFKDFDASKWYYDEMVEATNSHELTRRGKASDKFGRVYEKWTRILPSDVK